MAKKGLHETLALSVNKRTAAAAKTDAVTDMTAAIIEIQVGTRANITTSRIVNTAKKSNIATINRTPIAR